ncbi:MAG: hypothetical protein HY321_10970 [Armatimonadetes bacterium]|nr:hypothetical protein [Armatimonadota bacterium]
MTDRSLVAERDDPFFRVLGSHAVCLAEAVLGPEAAEGFLRKLGESLGSWIEERYREARGVHGPLSLEQFAWVVADFKNLTGGCTRVESASETEVHFTNSKCPFAEVAPGADALCRLDAHILGSIAARNLGHVRLIGHSTLLTGGPQCRFAVHTEPREDPDAMLSLDYLPSDTAPPQEMREHLTSAAALESLRRHVGASQAALARTNRLLWALLGAASALSTRLEPRGLVRDVARYASQLAGGRAALVALAQEDHLQADGWWDGTRWHAARLRWTPGQGLAGRCAERLAPLVGGGDEALARADSGTAALWACAPILSPLGELLGVIAAQVAPGETDARLCLIEGLARQAAVALTNVRLYARQQREKVKTRAVMAKLQEKNEALAAAQERLVDAEKLAALGLFGQAIAHDVRNPLATIRAVLFALESHLDPDDAVAARARQMAVEQVQRAEQIIHDMLALTQRRPPNPTALAPGDAARRVAGTLSLPRGIALELACPDDLPPAQADPGHVQQILQNLCQNAIEAMEGAGTLRMEAALDDGLVRLRVADTGRGIHPDELELIFRPLWSRKGNGRRGYGIGLALCRELAQRNGGALTVESEPGRGSTFTLSLPVAPSG